MIRLKVPYQEKDEAKQYGARWNADEKYWYYPGDVLPEGLMRWAIPAVATIVTPLDPELGILSLLQDPPLPQDQTSKKNGTAPQSPDWLKNYKTVSEVNQMIQNRYMAITEFQTIMVWGEVTNFKRPNGGHYYFDIKDADALLPCIMWGTVAAAMKDFTLKAGMKVAIIGYLDYYKATGKTSLKVRQIKDAGQGEAALALLRLQARLEKEGLFDERFKKPIPKYPTAVGIVTSKDGEAIRDICKVAKMRNPYVQLLLFHVNVQGQHAVDTIIKGIRTLDAMNLDTLIIGRGGGSDEELMCYNNERVVRTMFEARTPIISAVGHEGNWSLADYVADLRVLTPTAAGQAALPDVMTDLERIRQLRLAIVNQMQNNLQRRWLLLSAGRNKLEGFNPQNQIERRKEQLQYLTAGIQTGFSAVLNDRKRSLEALTRELQQKMSAAFEQRRHRLEVQITRLHGLSPTAKLVKGFGYISLNEKPVTSVTQVHEGDPLLIRIHDGQIHTRVTKSESGGRSS